MKRYKVICPLIGFQIPNVLIGPHEMTDKEVRNFFKEREKQLYKEGKIGKKQIATELKLRGIEHNKAYYLRNKLLHMVGIKKEQGLWNRGD